MALPRGTSCSFAAERGTERS